MYCIIRRHTKDGCSKKEVEPEDDYVGLGQVFVQPPKNAGGAVMSQH